MYVYRQNNKYCTDKYLCCLDDENKGKKTQEEEDDDEKEGERTRMTE